MKLLIAEDDADLNEIIVKKLRAEGFDTDACFDGETAAERLLYADYDVAVLDIMMPVLDGVSAVRRLRAQGNTTPVILLTARDSIADKVDGLDAGANDYVVKPFSFDELIARIRAVTRTASGNPSALLCLDDLSLDLSGHVVRRGGTELTLTGKEYALLEYLMLNKGRILSREKIVSHVWGYDYEGGLNVVDVYVNYLRKKVDEGHAVRLLHTVRGIGYTMREPT
ncbi:MAG: response regulator transcription factor [Oscillospiraceae bacterium]|nr:response regulator transcription factor [Oscillospiraceae bacterium]